MSAINPLPLPLALLPFAVSLGGWVLYFRWKARGHRTSGGDALAVAGGMAGAPAALLIYTALDCTGLGFDWSDLEAMALPEASARCLLIGIIEETLKAAAVLLAARGRRGRSTAEGIRLAAHAGLGYATAEGLIVLLRGQLTLTELLARAAAAPLAHAVLAAPVGHALWALRTRRPAVAALGMMAAASVHGLYDLLLTRPHPLPPLSAGVILLLWLWVISRFALLEPATATPSSPSAANRTALRPMRSDDGIFSA